MDAVGNGGAPTDICSARPRSASRSFSDLKEVLASALVVLVPTTGEALQRRDVIGSAHRFHLFPERRLPVFAAYGQSECDRPIPPTRHCEVMASSTTEVPRAGWPAFIRTNGTNCGFRHFPIVTEQVL